jgi:hypothetical protein
VRRAGVIALCLGLFASLAVALAPAAPSDDRLEFAIVGIEARIGGDQVRSSGVVINADDGLVLTAAHSVWGATTLRLSTGVGVLHGRIVARAPCADLALLETQPRIPGLVALRGAEAATAPLDAITRAADDSLVRTRVTGAPDGTGAPVIDADGRIAGVVTAAPGRNPSVLRWPAVSALLDQLQPDKRRIYVGWRDQYRCTPRMHALIKQLHPKYKATDAVLNAPVPATRLPGTQELDR